MTLGGLVQPSTTEASATSRSDEGMPPSPSVMSCATGRLVAGPAVEPSSDASDEQRTYKKVAAAWKRPAGSPEEGRKAVVIASIQRDGKAPNPRRHLKSGFDSWDQAAVDAVTRAAPFGALPASYEHASVEVHFHFEYKR